MESLLYFGIVVAGLILVIVNEFVMWKVWPRIFFPDISTRRKVTVATLIIDPLVASILCPLASDLYFAGHWLHTCDFYFTFFIFFALFVLYGASLVMSFKIVSMLIPSNLSFHVEPKLHRNPAFVCFAFSLLINLLLTWTTLSLTMPSVDVYNPSEECFPFMIQDKVFFVCVVAYSFQAVFVILYAHLSRTVHRYLKSVHCETTYLVPDKNNSATSFPPKDEPQHDLILYAAISLICLLLSHGLRSAFIMCSCLPFLQMSSGIYWTNWLILAKLPSAGLLYCALSRFI